MSPRKLNLIERAFLGALRFVSEPTEGYWAIFMEEVVRTYGLSGFFKWAQGSVKAQKALFEHFGEKDTHLFSAMASAWNGCDYCAYGHLLAYNLLEYSEKQKLFPIDEREMPELLRMRDEQILTLLRDRLKDPEYQKTLARLERQYQLRVGKAQGENPDDRFLNMANALYEWVNECSIVFDAPAPPLGRVAKQRSLRARYESARAAARDSNGAAPAARA